MKLLQFKYKTNIFQNANKLKGQNIFINNDFSKATWELKKDLKIGYLKYSATVSREKIEK